MANGAVVVDALACRTRIGCHRGKRDESTRIVVVSKVVRGAYPREFRRGTRSGPNRAERTRGLVRPDCFVVPNVRMLEVRIKVFEASIDIGLRASAVR